MYIGRHPNMLGLKSLQTAKKVIAGIEVMHMIKKGQTLQGEKFVQNHDLFGLIIYNSIPLGIFRSFFISHYFCMRTNNSELE